LNFLIHIKLNKKKTKDDDKFELILHLKRRIKHVGIYYVEGTRACAFDNAELSALARGNFFPELIFPTKSD